MLTLDQIRKTAGRKAIIGIGGKGEAVFKSVESIRKEGLADMEMFEDAQSLVNALANNEIEGAVRGDLDAKSTLSLLKSEFGVEKLLRIAFLVMDEEKLVLLAPVGIDEGDDLREKMELIFRGNELLSQFKVKGRVGVLSGGRLEDAGRHPKVDDSLDSGERLTKKVIDSGIIAKHYGILLEEAFSESDMVIAPDGITGNLIFRSLHFLGGVKSMGAPIVNLDTVFVDTSRAKKDYSDSIILAQALCNIHT